MVGPVLYQEMLLGARRNRLYWFRWAYAIWLLLQFSYLLLMDMGRIGMFGRGRSFDFMDFAGFCRTFTDVLVFQHFLILIVAVPTLTAGAITDEKWRGTLQYLLAADLHPWEIVLGKLLGRSAQALLIAVTALPFLCFVGVFAGIDPLRLVALAVCTVLLVFALGSASLLASVLCRHTRDAVLGVYTVGLIFYLVARILHWLTAAGTSSGLLSWLASVLDAFNLLYPMGRDWLFDSPADRGGRLLASVVAWGMLGVVCLTAAVLRLPRSYLRYLEGPRKKKRHWWTAERPPVFGDPLRWKERHVEGVAPLGVLRGLPRWLGLVLVFLVAAGWFGWVILDNLPAPPSELLHLIATFDLEGLIELFQAMPGRVDSHFYNTGIAVMLIAGLVIGIRCSGAVTGEREKQTWEALLLTPLETRQLIRSKLWGILGASLPYLVAYAVPALLLALLCGFTSFFWILLWLGVTLLALAFVGAAGLWCSVRSSSSWRSLLSTLAFAYGGGAVLFCVSMPVVWILAAIITLIIMLIQTLTRTSLTGGMGPGAGFVTFGYTIQIAICFVLAGAFVLMAWRLVVSAEYRVGILERTKHWKNEPRRPRLFAPRRPRRPRYYDPYYD